MSVRKCYECGEIYQHDESHKCKMISDDQPQKPETVPNICTQCGNFVFDGCKCKKLDDYKPAAPPRECDVYFTMRDIPFAISVWSVQEGEPLLRVRMIEKSAFDKQEKDHFEFAKEATETLHAAYSERDALAKELSFAQSVGIEYGKTIDGLSKELEITKGFLKAWERGDGAHYKEEANKVVQTPEQSPNQSAKVAGFPKVYWGNYVTEMLGADPHMTNSFKLVEHSEYLALAKELEETKADIENWSCDSGLDGTCTSQRVQLASARQEIEQYSKAITETRNRASEVIKELEAENQKAQERIKELSGILAEEACLSLEAKEREHSLLQALQTALPYVSNTDSARVHISSLIDATEEQQKNWKLPAPEPHLKAHKAKGGG